MAKKQVVLSENDIAMNAAIKKIVVKTQENIIIARETAYDMYLMANINLKGAVKYYVSDECLKSPMEKDEHTIVFTSFTEAWNLYTDLRSAGSWTEWKKSRTNKGNKAWLADNKPVDNS